MGLGQNEKAGLCGICSAGCGVIVTYDPQGRMRAVRADETSPFGMICRIGEHSPEIVYSPQRIPHPLRRTGPKGTYDFKRISWDEAYDEIVARLMQVRAESGPEAAAIYTGSGSFDRALCDVFQPAGVAVSSASSVLFPFGSPNTLGVGALCYVAFAMIAPHVTFGSIYIDMISDIERAELIVVWGKNPAASCPPDDFLRIQAARGRGAGIVVIDPRRTALAREQDTLWVPLRPGTDGALALGMCNVLIEEELYDEAFARQWTDGFDEFRDYVQHFRPDYVEQITGVDGETMISLARRIAGANGAAPVMYRGLEYNGNGVQTIRAVLTLWALAGQLDMPGGQCFKMKGARFPINRANLLANPRVEKAAGHNDFPLYTKYRGEFHAIALPKAILEHDPYPIRFLLSLGASLTTSWPHTSLWKKTLGALDFFVSVDRQWTGDMAYADIVLPAATYYETESYMVYDGAFRIREKMIESVGEARYDFFIQAELARRLGYGELYPQTAEELLSYVLSGSGFTPEDVRNAGGLVRVKGQMMEYRKWEKGLLRNDGKPGFATPSGKFEIASSVLEEYGYEPLPRYVEPRESPASDPRLAETFPLVFNSGAFHNVDLHALNQSIPSLAGEQPVPTVMINTVDAEKRGIVHGEKVLIRTTRGEVSMYALVTDDIVRGAVEASGSGGASPDAHEWREAWVNELTDLNNYDPISGFPTYKALLCDVLKVGDGKKREMAGSGEYMLEEKVPETVRKSIYFDHNATSPLHPQVRTFMAEFLTTYGNPSSIHKAGRVAHDAIEATRKALSLLVGCTPRRLVFTSGGSEGNNFVIHGIARVSAPEKTHIITSTIEHPSVTGICQWLETRGFSVTYLPVDHYGVINPEELSQAITERTCLVSVMTANNETGSLQPISELARIARERGVPFHTDAVQAAGRMVIHADEWGVDFLTLSAHKFGGPKGTGAVYIRKGMEIPPLIHGGKQEGGLRGGTENTAGIAGMGVAAGLALQDLPEMEGRVRTMRDLLCEGICRIIPSARVNGHPEKRLPNTLNVTLPGLRGESVVYALDSQGVYFSSGSACKSGSPEPSQALLAMGLSKEEAHCSLRFSLGIENKEDEVAEVVRLLEETIETSLANVRFVSCR
ncbi:MAG TPA: aminotransferase class V-fold PLP-dependent enzyme [Syntrophorhabdaceae bacterium]|jgi:cysteine sulfinate desulfinase/cysteine desulfurase-like protein/anaerobic selenocysteine-containing dehydrogenase